MLPHDQANARSGKGKETAVARAGTQQEKGERRERRERRKAAAGKWQAKLSGKAAS